MTDLNNEFRLGWGFWTATEAHVTERFNGLGNPQGPAGEQITDDRVFHENGPTHAYQRLTYRYPREMPWFSIDLEAARYDSTTMTMVATVTNTTSQTRSFDVVFRAALAPGQEVEPIEDGLLLPGAVVGRGGRRPATERMADQPAEGCARHQPARRRSDRATRAAAMGRWPIGWRFRPARTGVIRIGVAEVADGGQPERAGTGDGRGRSPCWRVSDGRYRRAGGPRPTRSSTAR